MKKIALVTGGSGGIGSAVCRSLAAAGYTVGVGYYRNRAGAEALAREIGGYPAYADVSRPEEVAAMFAEAGEVETLVLSAGIAHYGLITDLTYDDWRELMAVNLDGAFLCCRAAVPGMVRRKRGNIILISSMWGQVGASCEAAYSASKSGLIGLTKALAKELAPSGIRVNCVAPGVVLTHAEGFFRRGPGKPEFGNAPGNAGRAGGCGGAGQLSGLRKVPLYDRPGHRSQRRLRHHLR